MTKYFPQSSMTKYHANDQRQTGITDTHVMMFIAGDMVSIQLSVVDSQNFKNIVSKIDPKYQMPS